MSLPSPTQSRRQLAARTASRALKGHQRHCHVCRRAARSGQGRCETGRELLYAAQAAAALAQQA